MHDAYGKELKVGDVVLVPAVISDLQPGEEYCNVTLKSVYGRRPDEMKETLGDINTGVLLRYKKEDTIGYKILDDARE